MKTILALAACLIAAAGASSAARAANPAPFPSDKVLDLFVAAQTVAPDGSMANIFKPGDTVIFRAYAADPATKKVVTAQEIRYFYVAITGQPNIKLAYSATAQGASKGLPWTGKWVVPASYPQGPVQYKVLLQMKQKAKDGKQRKGQFVPMPVASSILQISASPPPPFLAAVNAGNAGAATTATQDVALYVDTVNGTRPAAGTPARAVGCTQTNVYKRGEQVVVRAWGSDLSQGSTLLSNDNVDSAKFQIAGQPDTTLNYGAHGTAGQQVFFFAAPWIIPATFPMGETTIHVVFTLTNGKTGSYDQVINVIP
jgi:hypothetical protein